MSESLDPRERIRAAIADFRKGVESDGQVEILARCAEDVRERHKQPHAEEADYLMRAYNSGEPCACGRAWPCPVLQKIVGGGKP